MKTPTNLISGVAGAIVLNLIHEVARKNITHAPHVNKVGEEGVVKLVKYLGGSPPKGDTLYASTLVGDLIGNAVYFSAVGKGKPRNIWMRGIGLGLAAGLGAIILPSKMGLDDQPVKHSTLTQVLTVTWYTLGGVAAAGVAAALQRKQVKQ